MGRRRTGASDRRSVRAALILLAALLSLPGCSEWKQQRDAESRARITQFYARDPQLPKGEKTVLCYGVENAKSLQLSPPVEKVWPALTRCFEVSPAEKTTYTLTAQGADGRSIAQSVTVDVGPPLPKIIEVSVNLLEIRRGQNVSVCYKVKNATAVQVKPGRLASPPSLEQGCYMDQPSKTTTYTVTASGAAGASDTEHVTVKVK